MSGQITDGAVEAAATGTAHMGVAADSGYAKRLAQAALTAALPHVREQIAREIEAQKPNPVHPWSPSETRLVAVLDLAARIARGES